MRCQFDNVLPAYRGLFDCPLARGGDGARTNPPGGPHQAESPWSHPPDTSRSGRFCLTVLRLTDSPRRDSTAAWISTIRTGSSVVATTALTASATLPGRLGSDRGSGLLPLCSRRAEAVLQSRSKEVLLLSGGFESAPVSSIPLFPGVGAANQLPTYEPSSQSFGLPDFHPESLPARERASWREVEELQR